MKRLSFLIGLILSALSLLIWKTLPGVQAEDSHNSHAEKPSDQKEAHAHGDEHSEEGHEEGEEHDDHGEENHGKEADGDSHGHGEEEKPENVGPTKGVLSFDEHVGFKLSPEAEKNFSLARTKPLARGDAWEIPLSSLVHSMDKVSVYRERKGLLLAIPVKVVKKAASTVTIQTNKISASDSVISSGAGHLKVVELDLTSGEVGHSH
jgi:hypothetical protein